MIITSGVRYIYNILSKSEVTAFFPDPLQVLNIYEHVEEVSITLFFAFPILKIKNLKL